MMYADDPSDMTETGNDVRSPLDNSLNELHHALAGLDDQMQQLKERLRPISYSKPRENLSPETKDDDMSDEQPGASTVVKSIRDAVDFVDAYGRVVARMIDDLEV